MGHNGSARRGGGRHCALRHPQRTVCRAWFKPPGCRVVAVDHVDVGPAAEVANWRHAQMVDVRNCRRASAQYLVGQRKAIGSEGLFCTCCIILGKAEHSLPTGSVAETGSRLQSVEPTSKLPLRSNSAKDLSSGGVQADITAQSPNRRMRTANPDLQTGHLDRRALLPEQPRPAMPTESQHPAGCR